MLYNLALHPDVQTKVFEEIESSREIREDDFDEEGVGVNLNALPLLDAVVKETLRLFPAVPFYGRCLDEDLVFSDGLIVPRGCSPTFAGINMSDGR